MRVFIMIWRDLLCIDLPPKTPECDYCWKQLQL